MVTEMIYKFLTLCFMVFAMVSVSSAQIEVIGQYGNTYSIAEKDAYEEVLSKVKQLNWQQLISKTQRNVSKKLSSDYNLKRAEKDSIRYIDPTYTLEFDIADENGKVIYPAGYKFNPLLYMQFPYTFVFFNAKRVEELVWVKNTFSTRWDVILVATAGDIMKAEQYLNRNVYSANNLMINKFQVKATPTIVYTQRQWLAVQEVDIKKKNSKNKGGQK